MYEVSYLYSLLKFSLTWTYCVADITTRLQKSNKLILWEEHRGWAPAAGCAVQFSGVPFMVLGDMQLQCYYGPLRKRKAQPELKVGAV